MSSPNFDYDAYYRNSFEGLLEYGKFTIRTLLTLNAGAIVALLAFISSLISKPEVSLAGVADFTGGIYYFAGGTMLATLAAFMSYLNFLCHHENAYTSGGATYLAVTQVLSLATGFCSAGCFIYGVYLTAGTIEKLIATA